MLKCYMTGRTTKDVEMRYTQSNEPLAIASFSFAVDDGYGEKKKTSFFNCVAFGKLAERFEKYVFKGTKLLLVCKPQQEQYTNKDGLKVNTVKFIVEDFEFCESKASQGGEGKTEKPQPAPDNGFMSIPDGIENELPFQ